MTQPYSPNPVARLYDDPEQDADVSYGFQATVPFVANDVNPKQAIDAQNRRGISLWRVAAMPREPEQRWSLQLIYGTSSSLRLDGLEAPLVAYVPGNVQLYATPAAHASPVALHVSLKPVAGYNLQHVRSLVTNGGGVALPLAPSGVRFTALAASTVNIGGAAVALAVGASIPLVAPATLNPGGSGILEHEL